MIAKSTFPIINRKSGVCGTHVSGFYTFSTTVEAAVENDGLSPAKRRASHEEITSRATCYKRKSMDFPGFCAGPPCGKCPPPSIQWPSLFGTRGSHLSRKAPVWRRPRPHSLQTFRQTAKRLPEGERGRLGRRGRERLRRRARPSRRRAGRQLRRKSLSPAPRLVPRTARGAPVAKSAGAVPPKGAGLLPTIEPIPQSATRLASRSTTKPRPPLPWSHSTFRAVAPEVSPLPPSS